MDKWKREPLDSDEIEACISACDGVVERAAIVTLADTGMRKNELLSMRRDWVDFDKGILTIHVRKDYKEGENIQTKARGPKTKVERRIPMSERLTNALKAFFKGHGRFTYTPKQLWVLCVKVGKLSGTEKRVTPHIFRHSFITRAFYVGGLKPIEISKLSGHANAKMVEEVYLHVDEDETAKKLKESGFLG